MSRLQEVNRVLISKQTILPESPDRQTVATVQHKTGADEKEVPVTQKVGKGFAEKYLNIVPSAKQKAHLGQAKKRVEQISPQQD